MVVEPDEQLGREFVVAAGRRGIQAVWVGDGGDALVRAGESQPDVIVVAARLPTVPSADVVRIIRRRWPLCILVATGPEDAGLAQEAVAAGASAVIARPYDMGSILRLGFGADLHDDAEPHRSTSATAGPISVDRGRHEARIDGRELLLTHRELEVLAFLIERSGRVASSTEIMSAVWGHVIDTNTVAVHIKRLRDKIGVHPEHGQIIRTIRGAGYRLTPTVFDNVAAAT